MGIMEKKMEATIVYWGNIGIMQKKMEATIMENQTEKKMENEMETGIILELYLKRWSWPRIFKVSTKVF